MNNIIYNKLLKIGLIYTQFCSKKNVFISRELAYKHTKNNNTHTHAHTHTCTHIHIYIPHVICNLGTTPRACLSQISQQPQRKNVDRILSDKVVEDEMHFGVWIILAILVKLVKCIVWRVARESVNMWYISH